MCGGKKGVMDMLLISRSAEKNTATLLLENKRPIWVQVSEFSSDNEVALFAEHILVPRCLALDRPVKCTLQCHSYRLILADYCVRDLLYESFPLRAFHFTAVMLLVFGKRYFMS